MKPDIVGQLQNELANRCANKPAYSLRAFAKMLNVSPALLSLVLNRRREPSDRLKAKVRERLGLDERSDISDNTTIEEFAKINSLTAYAILGLLNTHDFKPDTSWIAKRLGISVHEVKSVLQQLVGAKILDCSSKSWKQIKPSIRINNSESFEVTRKFQKVLIEKALHSLDEDPIEIRDHSSITFCISIADMPAIKREIRDFRIRISDKYEAKSKLTDVYNLTVQLVPLTKKKVL